MNTIIAPSLLAADFLNLENEMKCLETVDCEWLHLDVMDGNFVPNQTFGYDLIAKLRKFSTKVFDVHLMTTNPEKYVDNYAAAGADYFTFHIEAMENKDTIALIEQVKSSGMKVGISIKPGTQVKEISEYLNLIDMVLVMSVEPGFGGQSFMVNSVEKIAELNTLRADNNYEYIIQVDGGINAETSKLVLDAGCDCLVAGSYLFTENMQERINTLRS